ncbi:hypothetical protein HQ585_10035 [candidate division KSB1 bacterium]|nr:hypothetical protein [candidate division KSB1 bacterium]
MGSLRDEVKDTVSESNHYLSDSLFAGIYKWRVKAGNDNLLWSEWSEIFYFTVVPEQSL